MFETFDFKKNLIRKFVNKFENLFFIIEIINSQLYKLKLFIN